jgi:hypothetical protein
MLAVLYRVPFPFTGEWAKYEFPPDSGRSGILTHVSMLSMFSHPGRSSPTIRGVALLEIFLCSTTPPPPPDVDFSEVNNPDPTKTVRERLIAHMSNPVCASCHAHSDPMGLSLEQFDTIGGYRTTENGKMIDVTAEIPNAESFSGAVGLGQYMHDNPRYPACVARKLYSYSRGLDSTRVRTSHFQAAFQAFENSGYRLRALLKSMAASETFYAVPPPPPSSDTTNVATNNVRTKP